MPSQHPFVLLGRQQVVRIVRVVCIVLLLTSSEAKKALIFDRWPHACYGCQYAMAAMLSECDGGSWETDFLEDVGDDIDLDLLNGYDLYVQPGGDSPDSGKDAFGWNEIQVIQQWVGSGGRYYGSCWGGYAIGDWVFEFIDTDFVQELYLNPEIPTYYDTKVTITWVNGTDFEVYFQDGPTWLLDANQEDLVTRLANYRATGNIAAMVFPYGKGSVGASGVHFEGRFNDIGYYNPEYPRQYGLGCSLLDRIMDYNGSSESELPQPPSAAQHVHFDTFTTVLCAASSYLLLLLGLIRSF